MIWTYYNRFSMGKNLEKERAREIFRVFLEAISIKAAPQPPSRSSTARSHPSLPSPPRGPVPPCVLLPRRRPFDHSLGNDGGGGGRSRRGVVGDEDKAT